MRSSIPRSCSWADKAGDWQRLGLWAGRLMFTTENARECVQVLERYLGRGSYQPNDYTGACITGG